MERGCRLRNPGDTLTALRLAVMLAACLTASAPVSAGNPFSASQLHAARRVAAQFEDLAGSPQNAWSLVKGLRTGTSVTLLASSPAPQRVSFVPATAPMGYGNIAKGLTIARKELAARGIAKPTPEELRVVLMGGSLCAGHGASARVVRMAGVLPLRSVHMGWGQVAQALAISPTSRPSTAVLAQLGADGL